jgi:serine/threonine protein kinase
VIGSIVGEHYLIERELGTDQFGKVYQGKDVRYPAEMNFSPVAIRIFDRKLTALPDFDRRFADIAPKLQACNQINIIRVYAQGYIKANDDFYLVSQMPSPNLLGAYIQRQRQLSQEQAGVIIDQLCAAIDYGQRQGLIHGNLNIWNVTLRDDGKIQVVDLGLMQMLLPFSLSEQERLLGWKTPVGIPEFLAPERFRGEPPAKYNDAYVLGVLLYLMITGRMPFVGKYQELVVAHSYQTPPLLNATIPNNIELNQYFAKILSKTPLDRFSMQDISIRYRQAVRLPRGMIPVYDTHPPLPTPPPPPEDDTKRRKGGLFGGKR